MRHADSDSLRPLLLTALALGPLFTAACGPGSTGAFLDVAFERIWGEMATVASVVALDADPAPAWLGVERAGLSATATPSLERPLEVCRVETGLADDVNTLRLLDPGAAVLRGPAGEQPLTATPPAFGEGTGYTARFVDGEADEIPYQAGAAYELRAPGAEAPAFTANFTAPPDYEVERLGFITPGPGTAVFSSNTDLEIVWAPGSDDEMYLLLSSGNARVVCRVRDDGSATIKLKYLQQLPLGPATLVVERSRSIKLGIAVGATGKVPGRGRIALRYRYTAELQ